MRQIGLIGFLFAVGLTAFVGAKENVEVDLLEECGQTFLVKEYDFYKVEIDGSDWPRSTDECNVTFVALNSSDTDLYYQMRELEIDDRDVKLKLEWSTSGLVYHKEATFRKGDKANKSRKKTSTFLRIIVVRDKNSRSTDIETELHIYRHIDGKDFDTSYMSSGRIVGSVLGCISLAGVLVLVVLACVRSAKRTRIRREQMIRQNHQSAPGTTITMATYPTSAYPPNTAVFAADGYRSAPPPTYAHPVKAGYPVHSGGAYPPMAVGAYPPQALGAYPPQGVVAYPQGFGMVPVGHVQVQTSSVGLVPAAPPPPAQTDVPSYPPPKYEEIAL